MGLYQAWYSHRAELCQVFSLLSSIFFNLNLKHFQLFQNLFKILFDTIFCNFSALFFLTSLQFLPKSFFKLFFHFLKSFFRAINTSAALQLSIFALLTASTFCNSFISCVLLALASILFLNTLKNTLNNTCNINSPRLLYVYRNDKSFEIIITKNIVKA